MSDLINRQDAIDALGEEPLVWDENDDYDVATRNQWIYDVECIKEVPSAELVKYSTELNIENVDLISRQAAIDAVSEACFELRGVFGRCEDALKALPSVERKKGKWINVNGDGSLWRCDQCKDTACCRGNYCPSCGADMRGDANGE